jgi:hypothetical protein
MFIDCQLAVPADTCDTAAAKLNKPNTKIGIVFFMIFLKRR